MGILRNEWSRVFPKTWPRDMYFSSLWNWVLASMSSIYQASTLQAHVSVHRKDRIFLHTSRPDALIIQDQHQEFIVSGQVSVSSLRRDKNNHQKPLRRHGLGATQAAACPCPKLCKCVDKKASSLPSSVSFLGNGGRMYPKETPQCSGLAWSLVGCIAC